MRFALRYQVSLNKLAIQNIVHSIEDKQNYIINGGKHTITPFDRGLAYGDGVFRTLKVNQGRPISWELHYQKLESDCNRLRIVCPSEDMLLADIYKLFANDEGHAIAKIIITRGESERGYALPVLAQPLRMVVKSKYPSYPTSYFSEGVNLHLCQLRLSHQPILAGVKHLNRLENVLARTEWTDTSIADGVLMDVDGYVIECTASNLFMLKNSVLFTPDLSNCGVSGVTREIILASGNLLGLKTKITKIKLNDLMNADEIIICNSLFGVWQVKNFNGHQWTTQKLSNDCREKLKI